MPSLTHTKLYTREIPAGTLLLLVATTLLVGCVGVDHVDNEVIGERIVVTTGVTEALAIGQQLQVSADYFDKYGILGEVQLQWNSSDPNVASVDDSGLITGHALGQTIIWPSLHTLAGDQITVTVINDPTAVATVEISSAESELEVGDHIQLSAHVRNLDGDELEGHAISWFSENEELATVSSSGEVTALRNGIVGIHAKVGTIKSNSVDFTITSQFRTGTFTSAGGYHTSGSAKIEVVNGDLILTFSSDFDTDFALGSFVYLANSTNGSAVRTTGFEVAQIYTDGAKSFNITQLNNTIQLDTYRYAVILCKPATVTFGYADFQ